MNYDGIVSIIKTTKCESDHAPRNLVNSFSFGDDKNRIREFVEFFHNFKPFLNLDKYKIHVKMTILELSYSVILKRN